MSQSSGSISQEELPLTEYNYPEDVQLWLKFNTNMGWVLMLTIPSKKFSCFTLRPLCWLRFPGFAICGCEGILLLGPDGPEVDDYSAGEVENLQVAYYYLLSGRRDTLAMGIQLITLPVGEPQLVDVLGMNDQMLDASGYAPSQGSFSGGIATRDLTCVLTGVERDACDTAHLILQSKGDEVCFLDLLYLNSPDWPMLVH
jgi:hypothetical protein